MILRACFACTFDEQAQTSQKSIHKLDNLCLMSKPAWSFPIYSRFSSLLSYYNFLAKSSVFYEL